MSYKVKSLERGRSALSGPRLWELTSGAAIPWTQDRAATIHLL